MRTSVQLARSRSAGLSALVLLLALAGCNVTTDPATFTFDADVQGTVVEVVPAPPETPTDVRFVVDLVTGSPVPRIDVGVTSQTEVRRQDPSGRIQSATLDEIEEGAVVAIWLADFVASQDSARGTASRILLLGS